MAYTVTLTDGTTSIDLVYDASSQTTYKVRYGMQVGTDGPRAHWHQPDDYPRQLIDVVDDVRQAVMTVAVRDADDDIDDVLNAIHDIRRLLRQAARHQIQGDADEVYLSVQRDGATNTTEIPVVYGYVDDGAAHYTTVSYKNVEAYDVPVILHLEPYGRLSSDIALANELASSPHFIEDSDSDGLADGWTAVGTPSNTGFNHPRNLIADQSQLVTVGASGTHGVRADDVTASSGTDGVAFVWLNASSTGNDPINIVLADGSANAIETKTFDPSSPANFDKSITVPDDNGVSRTWYRYVVSGTNSTAADFRLIVQRTSGNASQETTWHMDGAYLGTGTTTAPDAWMSAQAIDNRYDPTSSAENRINYIDIWGVPGDVPALVNTTLAFTSVSGAKTVIQGGRSVDGRILAKLQMSWRESDLFTTASSATNASWSSGTGTSDNHYYRLTQDGSGSVGSGNRTNALGGTPARRLLHQPTRAYGLVRSSTTNATFQLKLQMPDDRDLTLAAESVTSTGQWELVDFGLINLHDVAPPGVDIPDSSNPTVALQILIDNLPASGSDTADFDALLFIPTKEHIIIDFVKGYAASSEVLISGTGRYALEASEGIKASGRLGTLWELEPGHVMNRLIFTYGGLGGLYTLTDAADVSLSIRPRTRHLIGTR